MSKRFLLDTNIILDIALERNTFYEAAKEVLFTIEYNQFEACISATTVTDIWYVASKQMDRIFANQFLADLVSVTTILSVHQSTIIQAMQLNRKDFEDSVQTVVAQENNIDAIITRNKKDFLPNVIELYNPQEFIDRFNQIK